jgi:hypothetical protein
MVAKISSSNNLYGALSYNQNKADVKQIVADEFKRIAEDPALQHLIKKE